MKRRTKIQLKPKAKTPKARRAIQKRLEENLTPLETIKTEQPKISKRNTIPTQELRNVIAETIMRVFPEEFGQHVDDVNAREYYADRVAWAMKYGGWNQHGYAQLADPIPMHEKEFKKVPRCKAHRRKS